MEDTTKITEPTKKSGRPTIKLLLIFFLTLLLLLPQQLVMGLIDERESYKAEVTTDVTNSWSDSQLLTSPVLVIPYTETHYNEEEKKYFTSESTLTIMPETNTAKSKVNTTNKHRSIYEVLLYQSDITTSGSFKIPSEAATGIKNSQLLLEKAYVSLGISQLKGIRENVIIHWDGAPITLQSGLNNLVFNVGQSQIPDFNLHENKLNTGLHAQVPVNLQATEFAFDIKLNLHGSKNLLFSPTGKSNSFAVNSSFNDPIFIGKFLPEHKISDSGFTADWKISEYNRNIPSFILGSTIDLSDNIFGVKIETQIDNYTKTYRAVKYMILFIILTFLTVFITEQIEDLRIHIFQYALIGFALVLFFTLLLSISEFIDFNPSYFIATLATVGLIAWYSLSLFKSKKSTLLLTGFLGMLFGFIFTLIQLEKFSLLVGTLGLFVILAATMYVSRKIKWFESPIHMPNFLITTKP